MEKNNLCEGVVAQMMDTEAWGNISGYFPFSEAQLEKYTDKLDWKEVSDNTNNRHFAAVTSHRASSDVIHFYKSDFVQNIRFFKSDFPGGSVANCHEWASEAYYFILMSWAFLLSSLPMTGNEPSTLL